MDNFIENALELRERYYVDAVDFAKKMDALTTPSISFVEVYPFEGDVKSEILSQLVAVFVNYRREIPSKFSIKLSHGYFNEYLLNTLQEVFDDLSTNYKVISVSSDHSLSSSAYTYNIFIN